MGYVMDREFSLSFCIILIFVSLFFSLSLPHMQPHNTGTPNGRPSLEEKSSSFPPLLSRSLSLTNLSLPLASLRL